MDYLSAVGWLYARQGRGIQLGLGRVRRLLDAMDRPQESFAAFHVAGTNGKGSTAALIEAALRCEGYRTGLYLSPHVNRFTERIQVEGSPATDREAAHGLAAVAAALERLPDQGRDLTFFEIATAAAFDVFRSRNTEVAVVEVGLGGRLDATNLVRPVSTVVTNVGRDHLERLGGTVEAAAREKAGIVKSGVPVVTACDGPALEVVAARAAHLGAAATRVSGRELRNVVEAATSTRFDAEAWGRLRAYRLGLLGRHQALNALTAIRALESSSRFRVLPESAEQAFPTVSMPGRLEWAAAADGLLLDGAHNPEATAALASFVRRVFPGRPIRLVFGCLREKEVGPMLAAWSDLKPSLVCPPVPNARARPPEEVSQLARGLGLDAVTAPDLASAVAAVSDSPPGTLRLVTGSLFLVGAARRLLLHLPGEEIDVAVSQ